MIDTVSGVRIVRTIKDDFSGVVWEHYYVDHNDHGQTKRCRVGLKRWYAPPQEYLGIGADRVCPHGYWYCSEGLDPESIPEILAQVMR